MSPIALLEWFYYDGTTEWQPEKMQQYREFISLGKVLESITTIISGSFSFSSFGRGIN